MTCPNCGYVADTDPDMLDVTFDFTTQRVNAGGRSCRLSPTLMHVLEVFLDAYPEPVTVDSIYDELFRDRPADKQPQLNTVRVHITNMRGAFAHARMPLEIRRVSGRHDQQAAYMLASVEAPNRQQSVA